MAMETHPYVKTCGNGVDQFMRHVNIYPIDHYLWILGI